MLINSDWYHSINVMGWDSLSSITKLQDIHSINVMWRGSMNNTTKLQEIDLFGFCSNEQKTAFFQNITIWKL